MSKELPASASLSHYRISAPLGVGGMGEVYLAEDTRLIRKVALKLQPAELTSNADRAPRFEQKAQAASALHLTNIITVYDIGESEAGHFSAREVVAGRFAALYAGTGLAPLVLLSALAVFAFYTSLGGQKVFAGKLLED
jgi:serine/threonine protein kinase